MKGKSHSAASLILEHLLPMARAGLKESGIASEDIDRYLGTVEERVRSGQTGSQWMLRTMRNNGTRDIRLRMRTEAMLDCIAPDKGLYINSPEGASY